MKPKISTFNSIREQCSSFAFHKSEPPVFHVFCQHFIFAFRSKNKRALKSKTSQPINNQVRQLQ